VKALGEHIIENRTRRGWPSATDLSKTTRGLVEELGEYLRAERKHRLGHAFGARDTKPEVVDALGDVLVYALGALAILGDGWVRYAAEVAARRALDPSSDDALTASTFENAVVALGHFESMRKSHLETKDDVYARAMVLNIEIIAAFAERELRAMEADPETVVRAILGDNAERQGQVPH
jgi:NTP pyrophosphatase (non-canonical NTP hydrolase)